MTASRRTRVVIQSRLSSSRLPGKALMSIAGMPLIELVARRASRTGDEVVVATSVEAYDTRIADHLERVGIPVVRGPLDDVLGRFVMATADLDPDDRVVRLTGDNPIADADLVHELLDAMDASGNAYGRVDIDRVPEGLGAEGFSVRDLRIAAERATAAYDREHVTPWLRRELGELLFVPAQNPGDPVAYRCTTDCLNDYYRISRLFDDEPDPVGVPWGALIGKLKADVDSAGPMVPVTGLRPRTTSLLLGTRNVGRLGADTSRDGATVRDVFVSAVNRGLSHDVAEPGTVDIVRQGTLPALQQRLRTILRLPVLVGGLSGSALHYQVRTAVENGFAHLARRSLAAVVFGSVANALDADATAWATLAEYRADQSVGKIGVSLASPAELGALGRLPGVDLVVADVADRADLDGYAELARRGATRLAVIGAPHDERLLHAALDAEWVDAVVVNPVTVAQLDASIRAAAVHR
ncbi:cytidylyltransferase domain-containing protein [Propionicicella superfundia]|uniref:cytidylyltransferase domain-containing protein n=1 Tax=Propionicicella superfundia TaxID=348582 RepID=UPI000406D8BC|nr:NTP transferase domain-containing protein [Propionicicella superfundia]